MLEPRAGNTISSAGVTIYVPPETQDTQPAIAVQPVSEPLPPAPEGSAGLGEAYDISADGELTGPVLVTLSYDPAALSPGVSEQNLYLATTAGGGGPFIVEDITFRSDYYTSDAVIVEGGQVSFANCRFTEGDAGLRLRGNASGSVEGCDAFDNEEGIALEDYAQVTLEGNDCTDNTYGIHYYGNSGGAARRNNCSENSMGGIEVEGQAQPTLEDNTCARNHWDGIAFSESSGGVARDNDCSGNEYGSGILVRHYAQPELEGNTCNDNEHGIRFLSESGGSVRNNTCAYNRSDGLAIQDDAHPYVSGNNCYGNGVLDFYDWRD